jgi:hypothetical protein
MTENSSPEIGAYDLLSKPTLDLSDAEVDLIIADLRKRRAAYVSTGKADRPKKEKAATVKLEKDDKARNTAALLASLKLPGME